MKVNTFIPNVILTINAFIICKRSSKKEFDLGVSAQAPLGFQNGC